ncbi:MAG: amidohydrolase family protein [Steroidobacteraceae bacterium]
MSSRALILRNVEIDGRSGLDVRVAHGVIKEIGALLEGRADEIDGRGGALIPGLVDHHIHLLALARQASSIDLTTATTAAALQALLTRASANVPRGTWLRAVQYHEHGATLLSRDELDHIVPAHPLRVQHQTGALWILNSRALEAVCRSDLPDCVERDANGRATGRIWRGDAWLHSRMPTQSLALDAVGRQLASYGFTALTDASATTGESAAKHLAKAVRERALPQRLSLMSAGELHAPEDGAFAVGAVKVLLDDAQLPEFAAMTARIARARTWQRRVAVHCVTAGELALTLAAFREAGTLPGDRIEHGGMISADAIAEIKALGLAVVTQPGFVLARGDRYLQTVAAAEHDDLYRCASLLRAGVVVAASSDAPYGPVDPWLAMRAAIERRTSADQLLGPDERVDPRTALELFTQAPFVPMRRPLQLVVGARADLCLLRAPLQQACSDLDAKLVRATLIDGRIEHGLAD